MTNSHLTGDGAPESLTPESHQAIQLMMRGLIHELRNPLSAILTATSLLQGNGDLDEETAMLLGVVKNESVRMNRILTDFAAYIKPPPSIPEPIDLMALVEKVIRRLSEDGVLGPGITLSNSLSGSPIVAADPVQLEYALTAVLTNAFQAMANEGEVTLSSQANPDQLQLFVDDTGGGFAEAKPEEAFKLFFSSKPLATGLGLARSRQGLRSFGGDIDLKNYKSGARATLLLPRQD